VQSGSVTVAGANCGVPVGTPEYCVPGCGNEKFLFSAWETLLAIDENVELVGRIAESWEMAPDLSYYTWHIRPGIEFHQGWGELTAEDVAFTFNSINGATNPDSIHDNVGDFAGHIGETTVLDKYTVKMEITHQDVRQPMYLFSTFFQGAAISSKAVYDEFGAEGMREVFIGTGPFEMKEWVKDDHASLEALPKHWRKTPTIKNAKILAVPEPAAQVAMFETDEIQILRPELKDVPGLQAKGGVVVPVMSTHLGIFMSGNWLEKVGARTGNPLSQPGFDPSLAWVGNPEGPGCNWNVLEKSVPDGVTTWEDQGDLCDEMNDARLVRWAMSMCIDREALGETIYLGFGTPAYVRPVATDNPLHKDEWVIPFDCAKSKQLLTEAGYADGFDVEIYVGDSVTNQQVGEAIGGTWLDELGINVTFDRSLYQVIRPSYVDRSNKKLVLDSGAGGGDVDWPMDWPKGAEDNSWYEGGTMKAGSIPFSAITYGGMLGEPDEAKRLEMAKAWFDHHHYWKWQPGVVETPVLDMYNGDVMTWPKKSRTMIWWWSMPYPLEDIVLK